MGLFRFGFDPNQPKSDPSSQELFSINNLNLKSAMLRSTIDSLSLQSFRDLGTPMQNDWVIKKWKSMEILHGIERKIIKPYETSMDIGHQSPKNALKQKMETPSRKNKDGSGVFPSPLNSKEELETEEQKGVSTPKDSDLVAFLNKRRSVHGHTRIIVENVSQNKRNEENDELFVLKKGKKQSLEFCSDNSLNFELPKIDSDFIKDKETKFNVSKTRNFTRLCSRKPRSKDKEKTTENKPESNPDLVQKKEMPTVIHKDNNHNIRRLFDYEFDGLRAYRVYFYEGNFRNVIKRITQMKVRNSPKVMSPRASIRKRQQSPLAFRLAIKK